MIWKQILGILTSLLFYQFATAQITLQGKILNDQTGNPLPSVSVYLNSTSLGTVTDEQGRFTINNIPYGKFRLVVSSVGFETYIKLIDPRQIGDKITISLKPKTEELKGFEVRPPEPDGWARWGKLFTDIFIGTTFNSRNCQLENPEVIKFRLIGDNTLVVNATEPLRIHNEALGYNIQYKMEEFEYDFSTKIVSYNGYAFFKDLSLTYPKKAKRWKENRLETYNGSLLHFMRTFFVNRLDDAGFEMRSLATISNPEKDRAKMLFRLHRDSLIIDTVSIKAEFLAGSPGGGPSAVARHVEYTDSTVYYKKVLKQADSVISHQIVIADSIGSAADSSTAAFYFPDSLEVSYKLGRIPSAYKILSRSHKKETYPVSQFVFVNRKSVYVLNNGYYYGPHDLKITGYWAWSENLSSLLPFNYSPSQK